jgi:phage terminase large subunit-like protein
MPNLAPATGEFERLVIAHKLYHNGHPVLSWQAGHVTFKTDLNNNKRPIKPGDRDERKIDGIVATVMPLGRAMVQSAGESPEIHF